MYNITLKFLEEINGNEIKEDGMPSKIIYIHKAKDILERFEVALRNELEKKYKGDDVKQEIKY